MTRILAASAPAPASSVALPPIGMPRLAQVPPPYGVIAVSPDSTVIASIGSAELVADDLGQRGRRPWPWLVTPDQRGHRARGLHAQRGDRPGRRSARRRRRRTAPPVPSAR